MYNYHIIVDGKLQDENNFCPSLDAAEICISLFLNRYAGDVNKLEIIITRQK